MKIRWISFIVLVVTLLIAQVVSYGEDEQKCQPDVIVLFGNGVLNNKQQTRSNMLLLQNRLNAHISGTDLDGKIRYGLAHNPSEGALADLLETFEQNFQTEKSKFWRFLAGLDLMPDILQDRLKEIAAEVDADIVSTNPSVQEHIAVYDQYLSEGNVVVLVAHSQGNLYGNIAHLGLDQQYIDGFGIVSVANPDSYIAGGGPYTTIEEDYIISPLQFVYPFALSPNLDNFTGPVNLADWSGHKFIESYMASGHAAEIVILDNVVNMINELSQPLCCIDFTADVTSGQTPLYVTFTPIITGNSDTLMWYFGDGSPPVEVTAPFPPSQSHIFNAEGVFSVSLTAFTSDPGSNFTVNPSSLLYRGKGTQGSPDQPNSEVHASFLAKPWSTWKTSDLNTQAWYAAYSIYNSYYNYTIIRYSAREVQETWVLPGSPNSNILLVQLRLDTLIAYSSGPEEFLSSDPSRKSSVNESNAGTWITMFDVSDLGGQTITTTIRDANSYPLIPDPLFNSNFKGWSTRLSTPPRIIGYGFNEKCKKTKPDFITVGM